MLIPMATMEVTYTDGRVENIPEVMFQDEAKNISPISVNRGVLEIETSSGELWYLVNVRKFRFIYEGF